MGKRHLSHFIILIAALIISATCVSCASSGSVRKDKAGSEQVKRKRTDWKKKRRELKEEYVKDAGLRGVRAGLVAEAITWLGTPYKYAAAEKGEATDCSGLTLQVYLQAADIKIPRNSARQAEFCKTIEARHVLPGDLVFFATGKQPGKVTHVGMMLDDVSFIHASSSKGVVVSRMDNPWYAKRFVKYGRVPGLKK